MEKKSTLIPHLLSLSPWAGHLISPCLSFLLYKMDKIVALTSLVIVKIKWVNPEQRLA